VSRFDGSVFYTGGSRFGAGLSYASLQRSNAQSASNALGVAVVYIPEFTKRISAYGSLGYYPSLPAPAGKRGSLETVEAGVAFANPGTSNTFERLGVTDQIFAPTSTSPGTLLGIEFGIGASF
jgi:hypothetical protein